MSATSFLRRIKTDQLPTLRRDPIDEKTMEEARGFIQTVRREGEKAVRELAFRFGELNPAQPLILGKEVLETAFNQIPQVDRELLQRVADRIRRFAEAQKACLLPLQTEISGGIAGHRLLPVERVGCYAPGGRYPLPSTVLMTAIPARVAGVREVFVASPKPSPYTLAAAFVAGADSLAAVGGAHAIAALAYGAGQIPAVDMIVGPGNRWVTAAKLLVSGRVAVDLPGGPSELVVIADNSGNAEIIAADLLAQAEHDVDALPIVISTDEELLNQIETELEHQLDTLSTAATAREALRGGFGILAENLEEAATISNRIAPEHLQLHVSDPDALLPLLEHYGALFIGEGSAEVFGDYGIGPNHVLPTGGSARAFSGLSVFTFLRTPSFMRTEKGGISQIVQDSARLARIEGLEAHARAAEQR